jgi:phosphatidylinositol alpha-1,6-mannosyltransferase
MSLHIGIVAPEYPPDIGGMQTYAQGFSRALAEKGHKVTVLTRFNQPPIEDVGVEVLPILKIRRRIDRHLVSRFRFDVWHVMNAAYSWFAVETAPVVASVHGNDFLRPYMLVARPDLIRASRFWARSQIVSAQVNRFDVELGRWLTGRLVRRSISKLKHVFANSLYTQSVFLQRYPALRDRVSAPLVGVGEDYLKVLRPPRENNDGITRLVTLCRLAEPRKNVDLVLRALATLKDRYRFVYTVIGDGHLRPELEQLAENVGLADRVEFTGSVDDSEVRARLVESDLFILTSSILPGSHEGFGIVYLESAACGTPVLAARNAGAVEAVKEGASGFFIDDISVDAIARAIQRFFEGEICFDPTQCQAFARGFTWRKVTDQAEKVYDTIIG